MNTLQKKLSQSNVQSVLFFLVDLYFSYLFIHEIGKLRVMCGIPLNENQLIFEKNILFIKNYIK